MNADDTRTRTITWQTPEPLVNAMKTLPGLDWLRAVVEGRLPRPPMAALMNFWISEVERGRVVFQAEPAECHYNPAGVVHGGFAATLLDSAMGCAIHSCLEAGDRYTTIELKVSFVKAITAATGPLRGIGSVVHVGRTTALADGRLEGEDGTLYAHATTTCLIRRS